MLVCVSFRFEVRERAWLFYCSQKTLSGVHFLHLVYLIPKTFTPTFPAPASSANICCQLAGTTFATPLRVPQRHRMHPILSEPCEFGSGKFNGNHQIGSCLSKFLELACMLEPNPRRRTARPANHHHHDAAAAAERHAGGSPPRPPRPARAERHARARVAAVPRAAARAAAVADGGARARRARCACRTGCAS